LPKNKKNSPKISPKNSGRAGRGRVGRGGQGRAGQGGAGRGRQDQVFLKNINSHADQSKNILIFLIVLDQFELKLIQIHYIQI
jgi:hypothetical protein